jgi:hypothetical protein
MLDEPLWTKLYRPICVAAVVFSLVALLAISAVGVWIAFSDVPIIGGAEPNAVYTIEKYLAGRPLYGDPDKAPFDVTQYSPLFYIVAGTAGRFFHVTATDGPAVLRLGRLTAFVFALAALWLQYRLLTGVLRVRPAIAVAAMAYAYVAVCPYLFYTRPDPALAVATLACFYFVFKATSQTGTAAAVSVAAGTVCALLAVLSKQSGVIVLAILLAYLLVSRQYRLLPVMCGVLLSSVVVGALWIGSVEYAQLLKANLIDGLNNGIRYYHGIINTFIPYVRSEAILICATGLAVLYWLNRQASRPELLFAISLPLLFVFAAVTGLKEGAGPNYYNEFVLLTTMAIAFLVQQRLDATRSPGTPDRLVAALALFAVVIIPVRTVEKVYSFVYMRSEGTSLTPLRSTQYGAYAELATLLRTDTRPDNGEYVLTYDRGLMTLIPSLCVTPQTELAAQRYQRGLSDMRDFRALVAHGRVKYVVFLKGQIWPEYLGVRLLDYFEHVRDFPNQSVYRYREHAN